MRYFYEFRRKLLPNSTSKLEHREIYRLQIERNIILKSRKGYARIYCWKTCPDGRKLYRECLLNELELYYKFSLEKWICKGNKKSF